MKQIITKDNSITFHNEQFDESYHSTSGAIEESFEKFAKPSNLKNDMHILDICFGLGYNSLAAISLANVKITALENDPEILKQIQNNDIFETESENHKLKENYEKIKQVAKQNNYKDANTEINLIVGDARETIKQLDQQFDVVFLDPFSPKKCPELWTEEFFKDIYKTMKTNSVLTTYSCAKIVRENLTNAGFKVIDGPTVGRRSPATIAYKQ